METTPKITAYSKRFGSDSFTRHIEQQLQQGWTPEKLQEAMRGTYANFPAEFRETLDDYLHHYLERWLNPMMPRYDMYIVVIATAEDLRKHAPRLDGPPTDEQIIDMINIMMMKVTRLAHIDRKLRKAWRIKKGRTKRGYFS